MCQPYASRKEEDYSFLWRSQNEKNCLKRIVLAFNLPNSVVNTGIWMAGHPFSPSLGCGTWGNNICVKNVTIEFYMNTTWLAVCIDRTAPTDEELFGDTGVMGDVPR